jgi:hypothetical protein
MLCEIEKNRITDQFDQIKLFYFILLKSDIDSKTPGICNVINDKSLMFVCCNSVLCHFYSVRVMSLLDIVFLYIVCRGAAMAVIVW